MQQALRRKAGTVERHFRAVAHDQIATQMVDHRPAGETLGHLGQIDIRQPLEQGNWICGGDVKPHLGIGLFGDRGRIAENRLEIRNDVCVNKVLKPMTALGHDTPATVQIGPYRIRKRFDVALASVASRRGRDGEVAATADKAGLP